MLISGTVRLRSWQWNSGSAMVMLSMTVILMSSTLWTGLVGGWHDTLALTLVEEVAEGKGFFD